MLCTSLLVVGLAVAPAPAASQAPAKPEKAPLVGTGLFAGGGAAVGLGGSLFAQALIWRAERMGGNDAAALEVLPALAASGGVVLVLGGGALTALGGINYRKHQRYFIHRTGAAPRVAAGAPLFSVGGAAIAASIYFFARGFLTSAEVEDPDPPPTQAELNRWRAGLAVGGGLLAVGVGALTGGIYLRARHGRAMREHGIIVRAAPIPGGGMVGASGRF